MELATLAEKELKERSAAYVLLAYTDQEVVVVMVVDVEEVVVR